MGVAIKPYSVYWRNILYLYGTNFMQLSTSVNEKLIEELQCHLEWIRGTLCKNTNSAGINCTDDSRKFLEEFRRLKRKKAEYEKERSENASEGREQEPPLKKPNYCSYMVLLALRDLKAQMQEKKVVYFSDKDKERINKFLECIDLYQVEYETEIVNNQSYNRNIISPRALGDETIELVHEAFIIEIANMMPRIGRREVPFSKIIETYGWEALLFKELRTNKKYDYEFRDKSDKEKIENMFNQLLKRKKNKIARIAITS